MKQALYSIKAAWLVESFLVNRLQLLMCYYTQSELLVGNQIRLESSALDTVAMLDKGTL